MIKHYIINYEYEIAGWDEYYKTQSDTFRCNAPSLNHALKQLASMHPKRRVEWYEFRSISLEEYENSKLAKSENSC